MSAGHFLTEPVEGVLTNADGTPVEVWHSDCTCGIRVYGSSQRQLHQHEGLHLAERQFVEQINQGRARRSVAR